VIAKEITELHGGVLKASSAGRGQGTRFVLSFPRMLTSDATTGLSNTPDRPNLVGKRVLIVDDDADSREIATQALTGTGAEVTQAASGAEALEQWHRQPFDVLICDLAMPGMDGYEVLRNIRSSSSDGLHGLAIALTALASDSDRNAVLAAGFDDHIVKPYSFPDLLRAVSRAA
jgi:CheY-like chemotaxis protein